MIVLTSPWPATSSPLRTLLPTSGRSATAARIDHLGALFLSGMVTGLVLTTLFGQ
ncbi:hypothetical protein ACFVZD_36305 [Streptomyces sp. NPDC058287]|uniref:hypothetical protein n=1 Tax=unclassified Streptomyces TaxID=2593676 RepID=UPI0036E15D0C